MINVKFNLVQLGNLLYMPGEVGFNCEIFCNINLNIYCAPGNKTSIKSTGDSNEERRL